MKQKVATWFLVACATTVLVGCGGHAAAPTPNNSANVAAVSNATDNNSTDNSTDNNVNISTVNTTDNSTNATNDASNNTSNSTNVTIAQVNVNNESEATNLLMTVYASQAKKDKNFKVSYQGTQTDSGHTVYVYQLYDDMGDHQATLGWVWVRDDGMFQDGILKDGWDTPSDWAAKVQQQVSTK